MTIMAEEKITVTVPNIYRNFIELESFVDLCRSQIWPLIDASILRIPYQVVAITGDEITLEEVSK